MLASACQFSSQMCHFQNFFFLGGGNMALRRNCLLLPMREEVQEKKPTNKLAQSIIQVGLSNIINKQKIMDYDLVFHAQQSRVLGVHLVKQENQQSFCSGSNRNLQAITNCELTRFSLRAARPLMESGMVRSGIKGLSNHQYIKLTLKTGLAGLLLSIQHCLFVSFV